MNKLNEREAIRRRNELFLRQAANASFEDTFITQLEESETAKNPNDEPQIIKDEPLVPFICPPPPHLVKRKYYSLLQKHENSKTILTNWERAVLSRLENQSKLDEKKMQERLCHTKQRNHTKYIQAVQERRTENENATIEEICQTFSENEQRRAEVFFRYKNLPTLRMLDKFIARSQLWFTILVSHAFITSLIHERKVQEAMKTFSRLLSPMIRRYVALLQKRRACRKLTTKMLPQIPYPTPQIIESMPGTFFKGWPSSLLQSLGEKSKPTYMKKGTYLLHAGDVGRAMFMITLGQVRIIFKKKNNIKKRNLENASGSLVLNSPCYVGEFALVCKEPRSASIICETDIGFWTVSPADFEEVAKFLSQEVASKQREATDGRRRQNLKNLFPLKVEFLRKFTYFEKFSTEALTKIVENVEPIVLHDGDHLISVGDIETSTFFIQDGIALYISEDRSESQIKTGTCIGLFDCACGVNERKKISIVSINYCDIWKMSRELLMDVGFSEPNAFLHCRKAAKTARALEIKKDSKIPHVIRFDPFLSFCFLSSHLTRFYELCVPCVYLRGERIVLMGQAMTTFIVILNGSVDITVANNGEHTTFRITGNSNVKDKKLVHRHFGTRGQTLVLGSYEYAASLQKYSCTAVSCGLTEAYTVDLHEVNPIIPPELQKIIRENLRGKEIVNKAYTEADFSCISSNAPISFSSLYKNHRDKELSKKRKN